LTFPRVSAWTAGPPSEICTFLVAQHDVPLAKCRTRLRGPASLRTRAARTCLRAVNKPEEGVAFNSSRRLSPENAASFVENLHDRESLLLKLKAGRSEYIKDIRELRTLETVLERGHSDSLVPFERMKQAYLDVVRSDVPNFDVSDLSLLLRTLMENDMSSQDMDQVILHRLRSLCSGYLEMGEEEGAERLRTFDARNSATMIHCLGKRKLMTSNTAKVLDPVLLRINDYNPIQIGLILNVYSRGKIRSPALFAHFSSQLVLCDRGSLDMQAVSNIVNAFANSNMKDQKLFAFLAEVVMSMSASNMTSQSLSTIVSSYTKLGLFDERLFEHLATSAMSLPSSSFSLKDLLTCASSFQRCESLPPPVFRYLLRAMDSHDVTEIPASLLATHCRSLVKLKQLGGGRVLYKMKPAVLNTTLDLFSLSSFAISFLQAGMLDGDVWQHLEQNFIHHLDAAMFNKKPPRGREIGSILSALVKSGYCTHKTLNKVQHCMQAFSFAWVSSQDLSSLLSAFARVGGNLDENFRADVTRHLLSLCDSSKLPADDAIIIGGAMVKLRMVEEELMERISGILSGGDQSKLQPVQVLSLNTMIYAMQCHPNPSAFASSISRMEDVVMAWIEKSRMKNCPLELGCKLLSSISSWRDEGGGQEKEERRERVKRLLYARVKDLLSAWWEDNAERDKQTGMRGEKEIPLQKKKNLADTLVLVSQTLASAKVQEDDMWKQVIKMYRSLPSEQRHATSLASILQSVARVEFRDESFLQEASKTVQSEVVSRNILSDLQKTRPDLWSADPKTIASLCTSFIGLQFYDENLFRHMANVIQQFQPSELRPPEISKLLNAFLRVDLPSDDMVEFLSSALRNQPAATSYTPNVLVSLFKDLPRAGVEDLKVYEQLKYALFLLNPRDLSDVQAAAIAIAMVKLQWREQDIWEFVVLAVRDRSETINPQVALNFVRAQAFLYFEDSVLLEGLLMRIISQDHTFFNAQDIASLSWSVAVLSPLLPPNCSTVIHWILRAILSCRTSLEPLAKAQIHQFFISFAFEVQGGLEQELLDQLKQECLQSFQASSKESLSSTQQADMSRVLKGMGYEVHDEHLEARTGYSLDCWLPHANTAVEFDGPSHFSRESHLPLGSTRLKRRLLKAAGYRLTSIGYWEWPQDASVQYKQELLARALEEAKAEG